MSTCACLCLLISIYALPVDRMMLGRITIHRQGREVLFDLQKALYEV